MRNRNAMMFTMMAALVLASTMTATATVVNLADANSSVIVDTSNPRMVVDWTVDGQRHMAEQMFFLSVNGAPQQNIAALPTAPAVISRDTNGDLQDDRVDLQWAMTGITARATLILRGTTPGSGSSNISELLSVVNTTGSAVTFSLFQYVNFDLAGTPGDDTLIVTGGSLAQQSDPTGWAAQVSATPMPTAFEAGLVTDNPSILDRLQAPVPAVLNNVPGPVVGDGAVAFQWDFTLQDGQSFLLSAEKNIAMVPEPATLVLAGIGGLMMTRRGHRQQV